jgi:hypothetical protein
MATRPRLLGNVFHVSSGVDSQYGFYAGWLWRNLMQFSHRAGCFELVKNCAKSLGAFWMAGTCIVVSESRMMYESGSFHWTSFASLSLSRCGHMV